MFADFRQVQPVALGTVYAQTLDDDGVVMNSPSLARLQRQRGVPRRCDEPCYRRTILGL
ncbi:MAG: hypothetical protein R2849_17535 [Thermomicrobiales bacterium]